MVSQTHVTFYILISNTASVRCPALTSDKITIFVEHLYGKYIYLSSRRLTVNIGSQVAFMDKGYPYSWYYIVLFRCEIIISDF